VAKTTILLYKPQLFIELDDNNLKQQGYSAKVLISMLEELGYRIIHSETLEHISSQQSFSNCHYDIKAYF